MANRITKYPIGRLTTGIMAIAFFACSASWLFLVDDWYWVPLAIYLGLVSAIMVSTVVVGLGFVSLLVLPAWTPKIRIFMAVVLPWVGSSLVFAHVSNATSMSVGGVVMAVGAGVAAAALTAAWTLRLWARNRRPSNSDGSAP